MTVPRDVAHGKNLLKEKVNFIRMLKIQPIKKKKKKANGFTIVLHCSLNNISELPCFFIDEFF